MKIVMPLTVIVLLVTAGVLGYTIYNQSFSPKVNTPSPSQSPKQVPPVSQMPGPSQSVSTSIQKPPWLANLSAEEKAMFDTPAADAPEDVKQKYTDLVRTHTQAGSELNILKGCKPSPLSYSVDKTLVVTVKNRDTVSHTLQVGEKGQYTVSAGEAATFSAEIRSAVLSYGCDAYTTVGFLSTPP